MSAFDDEDCLRRYRDLAARRPDLFANPPGLVYQILTASEEIAAARAARAALTPGDTRVGVLAEDPYACLLREAVRFPDGELGLYNRVLVPGGGGVVVLPVLDGSVVLIHRFRHGTRSFEYEAPRGIAGEAATPADDASRELAEEIGAAALELVDLGRVATTSGIVAEWMQLFLARIDRVGAADRHEAIGDIVVLTPAETERLIVAGTIRDGPTLAAYLQAKLRGLIG